MNYYSLKQAIDLIAAIAQPFDMPQIADLCRQGKLTPLFPYQGFISIPCWHEEDGRPRYALGNTQKFNGCLTHDHLISLIDGYTDSVSLTDAATNAGDDMEILLFDSHQRDPEYATPDSFIVKLENVLLAADDVHRCIDAMKAEHIKAAHASDTDELSPLSAKGHQATIGILLELLLTSKGFDKNNKPNPPLYANQTAIVSVIDDQLIYGQGDTTLEERFGKANAALLDARKAKPRTSKK